MRTETRNKAKILAFSLVDLAFDILVPTLIYFVLRPLGLPLVLAISTGGMVVAAKAGIGTVGGNDLGTPRWTKPARRDLLLVANTAVAIALMFVLYALGVALVVCVVAGALVQGVGVVISVLGRGKVDGFALLVLVELAASVVLAFVSSNDPRFLAVRPVFYLAIGAVVLGISCFRGKPGILLASRPMAVAGDPKRAVAFDAAWRNSTGFRRLMRGATVALTAVIVLGSAAWVFVAFQFPPDRVLAANTYSELPLIILFVLFVIGFRVLAVPRATRFVEAEMA
jgi:hypothetical protein